MRWVCVLVRFVSKNARFSHVFLAFLYQHVGIKNARKTFKNASYLKPNGFLNTSLENIPYFVYLLACQE